MRRSILPILVLAAASLVPGLDAQARQPGPDDPTIQQWDVPWRRSRPRDPYVAPDGRVWFVGQAGNYAAVLDPKTGAMKRYEVEDDAFPHTLVVDPQGTVWYAGNRGRHIGKLDPATGKVTRYDMPDPAARDPHTIAFDQAGDFWFTVQGANMVGHMDRESGRIRLVKAAQTEDGGRARGSNPYGLKTDSRGRPWIALLNSAHIGTVDPATMEFKRYALPEGSRPRRLVIDSKDRIWYGDWAQGQIGVLDPATGQVQEFDDPNGRNAGPYGMAIDEWDRIWYVNTRVSPNRFVGFDPATQRFISNVAIDAGAIRHMYYDKQTRSIWFGTDSNTIGKAVVKPPRRGVD
jgi:virginiamycin B lyase